MTVEDDERPIELDPEYEAELLRRLEQMDRDEAEMLTLDSVMERLRNRPKDC